MKPTYVIFVPGTRGPSVHHATIEEAREEAKRLVEQEGCGSAMICQFVEGVERKVSVSKMKKNPLPEYDEPVPF